MNKRPLPVAVCATCAHIQYDADAIDKPCRRKDGLMRCNGKRRTSNDDWLECPTCYATGRDGSTVCLACGGRGWFEKRKQR
ncbi:DnaJ-class molecular chaperone [Mycoplana sp. BE70]|uniref:hypothetical protein n=1 Tax=Mycoplana sp. BE70 TaxID=2817775 RepID=UPI00285F7B90|nr:hypothetical protein [Mycoplana sp. BE70]MDR6759485.1 DnaJ-class molecular chaperone [Mycoplana sp. BE70]